MSENIDNSTNIDQLIPQMFDEMRSNLSNQRNSHDKNKDGLPIVTTQSLLRELEALDKIIPMIENIDRGLRNALPSHIAKIQETCKSTNQILDSWINIHSQAGYLHKLMNSVQKIGNGGTNSNDKLVEETAEVEKLKKILQNEQQRKTSNISAPQNVNAQAIRKPTSLNRIAKSNFRQGSTIPRPRTKPTGIPNVSSRLTRPTASSSRKMFK